MQFATNIHEIINKMTQESSCLFVTDEHVYERCTMNDARCTMPFLVLQAGEAHKDLTQVSRIWDFLHEQQATRKSLLVAIGGGTVTDLAGFAAATYKRGMRYVNVPTSLLAMVDASIGGKNGFNLHGIKNEIGCFYPPEETIICTQWLQTLPPKEWLAGYAEMLKHALIADEQEWWKLLGMEVGKVESGKLKVERSRLVSAIGAEWKVESGGWDERIKRSIAIKEAIVRQDPKEIGLRKALNFGHTIGHALEAEAIDRQIDLSHGFAVMEGMVAELYLSVTQLGMDKEALRQMTHLMIEQYGKPPFGCKDFSKLIARMRQDKKNESAEQINFTLLPRIGEAKVNCVVGEKEIEEALEYLFTI